MKVYFDSAATTQMHPEVIEQMLATMSTNFGNPSSTHFYGRETKGLVELTRKKVAKYIHALPAEVIFTSCGTESNNLILRSSVEYLGVKHIITSKLEHKCVAQTTSSLQEHQGVKLSYVTTLPNGEIDFVHLEDLLKNSTEKTLVSLMHANNEIGNLYDIEKIGALAHAYDAFFHSDMVQTLGHLPIDFSKLPVDFASCSAHKFHGPKGAGFAFVRKGTGLKAQITGGGQERNLRSGTENVPGIVGLGKAFELANEHYSNDIPKIKELKSYAIQKLNEAFPTIIFNGKSADLEQSLYTLISLLLPFSDGLIGFELDLKGVASSQGSACSSGAAKNSSVIENIVSADLLKNRTPLRISFSQYNTKEEIDYLVKSLKEIEGNLKS